MVGSPLCLGYQQAIRCRGLVRRRQGQGRPVSSQDLAQVLSRYAAKKSSFYKMYAGYRWRALDRLTTLLIVQNTMQAVGDRSKKWLDCVAELEGAMADLEAIGPLIEALLSLEPRCDVLIVDDNSTDGTTALLVGLADAEPRAGGGGSEWGAVKTLRDEVAIREQPRTVL